jgi:DeoR family suf operon transcriptional repressor
MPDDLASSDNAIFDNLRRCQSMTVLQLADQLEVTSTAVRQRLTRLMAQGYIERTATISGRGRPRHQYKLTDKGRKKSGSNFADLAAALWEEVRLVQDPEVRRGLIQRLSHRLSQMYVGQVDGHSVRERMEQLGHLFEERHIPFAVGRQGELPILTVYACPYPELASDDRSICNMERQMFTEVLGTELNQTECRLDGDGCCSFEAGPSSESDVSQAVR